MFFWNQQFRFGHDYDLYPQFVEEVTPEEFLQLYENEKENIQSVLVIPSRLGDRKFGRILIRRKRPVYQPLSESESYEYA